MEHQKGDKDKETSKPKERRIAAFGHEFFFKPKSRIYKPISAGEDTEGEEPDYKISPVLPIGVRTKRDILDIASFILALGTFAIVAYYTYYAGGQWWESIRTRVYSAESLKAIVRTAKATEDSNRPWLGLNNVNDKGIVAYGKIPETIPIGNQTSRVGADFEPNSVTFYLKYMLKNSGHSPASADITAEIVDAQYATDPSKMIDKVQGYCDKIESTMEQSKLPIAILPGEMNYNKETTLIFTPAMKKVQVLKPSVVGCIWYRPVIGEDRSLFRTQFYGHIIDGISKDGFPIGFQRRVDPQQIEVYDVLMVGEAN